MRWLYLLFAAAPAALLGHHIDWPDTVVFVAAGVAMVPAAKLLGDASEDLAVHLGPRFGGLLTSTMGSAAELIIALFAVRAGLFELAKASITGSILGNLLLVLGASVLAGGLRHGTQYYDRSRIGISNTMLLLSVVALAVPAMYGDRVPIRNAGPVESLSEAVATVMIGVYLLSLYYSLFWNIDEQAIAGIHRDSARWSAATGWLALAVAIVAIASLANALVSSVERTVAALPVTPFFLGIVVIPLVGNVAEHLEAIEAAWRNRTDTVMALSVGSSIQLALFVSPLLVFASVALGRPMDLIFTHIELVAIGAASIIATLVALDGESQWLEGIMLLAVYLLLALAFFWWPSPDPAGARLEPPARSGQPTWSAVSYSFDRATLRPAAGAGSPSAAAAFAAPDGGSAAVIVGQG